MADMTSLPKHSSRIEQRRHIGTAVTRAYLLALGLLSAGPLAAPHSAHAQAPAAEWSTPSGTLQGTRFSSLTEITSANVSTLVEEFSFPTGTKASHQGQPLVVGSTMYIVTPFPNKLIALDLRVTGQTLWTFDPGANRYARGVACCDTVNRGPAYADGKVIYNVLDGTAVAVDAISGRLVWRTKLGDPATGETLTGAPIVIKDKVIVGNAGGEMGVRGWVQALDVYTGRVLWKAYNTGPDADVLIGSKFRPFYAKDRGTDLGATTWPGTMWRQGGSTAWAWFTYDPDLNLLYYGTANPGVWNPDMRPGDNKWGATIFARNPDTGEAVWAYQLTPHESWDFDSMNETIVVDLVVDGKARKAAVHFDKNGFVYTFDGATGEVLSAEKFAHVTWADHVDLTTGAPAVNPGMQTHEGVITENICPTPLGAKEFVPAAYSPNTGLFYVPGINFCFSFEPLRALYIAGTPFVGANLSFTPGPGDFLGELFAWDASTGTRAWSIHEPLPLYSGVLATAGDIVFYGTLDKWFKAVDAKTGEVLFQRQLECGIVGNPITYVAPDGKQRVAVYTGVGWLAGAFAGGACPAGGDDDESESENEDSPMAKAVKERRSEQRAAPATTGARSGFVHVFKLP